MSELVEEFKFLDTVTEVVDTAVLTCNPEIAFQYAEETLRLMHKGGLALAKFLWEMKQRWGSIFPSDDDLSDVVYDRLGIKTQTYRKYTDMWEWLRYRPELWPKQIKGLLLLNAAVKENQLSDEDWNDIRKATDPRDIREVVRRIRGPKTSSSTALSLQLLRDGTLRARFGREDPYTPVGYINTQDTDLLGAVRSRLERYGVQMEGW